MIFVGVQVDVLDGLLTFIPQLSAGLCSKEEFWYQLCRWCVFGYVIVLLFPSQFTPFASPNCLAEGPTAAQCNTAESSYSGKGHPASKLPVLAPGRAVLPCPTTNLSIGMDMWNSTHAEAALIKSRPGMASSPMVGRKTVVPEQQWMQVI